MSQNIALTKVQTTHFVCEPFHVDFSGQLTLSVLGNHLLNCAGQHAQARGFGIARLNEEEHTWVLSRMAIEMDEMPLQYETFEIDTWVESVYRLFTDRNFCIRNHEGRTIGYVRTVWAMIGMQSRRPIELTSLYGGLVVDYCCPERPCPIDKPSRIKVTASAPEQLFTARYSDIDINGHVNSIRYIDMALDLFPLDWHQAHTVRRIELAYGLEGHDGDHLELYKDDLGDNRFAVEIRRPADKSTLVRVLLTFN